MMLFRERHDLWSIVLAAGDGTRLTPLTLALYGEELPKQFAHIESNRSLLQATVERALGWSAPERIVVVVASEREQIARRQLSAYGPVRIIAQPRNLGTGPGILLPLSHVLALDPEATVVLLPSDHYVRDDGPFRAAVQQARSRTEASGSVVLIGALPEAPDTQYGWIVPRTSPSGEVYVDCFEEKPNAAVAKRLLAKGGLWNTFVLLGSAARLWQLGHEYLPKQTQALDPCRQGHSVDDNDFLRSIYENLPPADFSRQVLEKASGLEVVALPECGWSDWGTPERVFASLRGTAEFDQLAKRLPNKQQRLAWAAPS
jgi:mannose-1-phosphate guanylyltransferase